MLNLNNMIFAYDDNVKVNICCGLVSCILYILDVFRLLWNIDSRYDGNGGDFRISVLSRQVITKFKLKKENLVAIPMSI